MTDLSTATVDEVLEYADGWRAAERGEPMDLYRSRYWLSGWSEYHLARAGIAFVTSIGPPKKAASFRGSEPESV